jgi:hypothetical protein
MNFSSQTLQTPLAPGEFQTLTSTHAHIRVHTYVFSNNRQRPRRTLRHKNSLRKKIHHRPT